MTDVTRSDGDTGDERGRTDATGLTGAERRENATGTTGTGTGTDRRDPTRTTAAGQPDPTRTGDRREATKATPLPRETDRETDKAAPRETASRERDLREETAGGEQRSARSAVHAPEPAPTSATGRDRDQRLDRPDTGNGSLLPHDESDKFNLRLQHAVTGFVDEPRSAVEEADHVLEEVAARFTEAVTKRRATLHGSWETKGSEDTEQLRLALRDYRELTERLLHL
ncbi:hypothetical protein ABZT04_09490 [Streptomyces sp. NPDC005492]|uniref:hypothetical protein n=1 Tax=Streptomyces sp. NPDC005492 TaxID=3156883 RepID=UPI0033BEF39F